MIQDAQTFQPNTHYSRVALELGDGSVLSSRCRLHMDPKMFRKALLCHLIEAITAKTGIVKSKILDVTSLSIRVDELSQLIY
jgi:hypothetical protein